LAHEVGIEVLTAIVLAAVALNPIGEPIKDRCALVEVSHVYDSDAKHVLSQLIFYDFDGWEGRYQVRAWRLLKSINERPAPDRSRGGYVAIWNDGGAIREVWSQQFRESWKQYDPEIAARRELPMESRRELTRPPGKHRPPYESVAP